MLASAGRAVTHGEIFRRTEATFGLAVRGAQTRELAELARPCLEALTATTAESPGLDGGLCIV